MPKGSTEPTVVLDDSNDNADWLRTLGWDGVGGPPPKSEERAAAALGLDIEKFRSLPVYQGWKRSLKARGKS